MANRLKSVGDGTASGSAVQTGKSSNPSAEDLVSLEELTLRPWLLGRRIGMGTTDTRSYFNACTYGEALATLLLKRLREAGIDNTQKVPLGWFLLAMAGERDDESEETLTSWEKGQIVGFCSALAPWLGIAVQRFGRNLDANTDESILDACNDALTGGPERRYDEHTKKIYSDNARKVANARWAKHREAKHA